jgi:hypothetical protein
MQYFLHHRYWVKDNDMLLKDAYADLMQEYNTNKDNNAIYAEISKKNTILTS